MNVIFLDIDYVLNGESTTDHIGRIRGIDDEKVALLKELVDYSNAILVLSSSWKKYWSKDLINDGKSLRGNTTKRYGRYINHKLAKYNLKIEDKVEDIYWRDRALEIRQWLETHPEVKNFVILDDVDFRWRRYGLDSHWVDTYEKDDIYWIEGLTPYHIEKAKNIFDKQTKLDTNQ